MLAALDLYVLRQTSRACPEAARYSIVSFQPLDIVVICLDQHRDIIDIGVVQGRIVIDATCCHLAKKRMSLSSNCNIPLPSLTFPERPAFKVSMSALATSTFAFGLTRCSSKSFTVANRAAKRFNTCGSVGSGTEFCSISPQSNLI
ncbi:hypothetical protein O181_058170 [Austropuccinia psidii MF-1]|uniref:Uncharacterized protein n=1 Tax=Austropuccinia psidii MF-1 TaxID=1389203 RepID=A0A9Q3HXM1_9BASI|nr:hypothetical protein [Austropuccinia psidii MF-1]